MSLACNASLCISKLITSFCIGSQASTSSRYYQRQICNIPHTNTQNTIISACENSFISYGLFFCSQTRKATLYDLIKIIIGAFFRLLLTVEYMSSFLLTHPVRGATPFCRLFGVRCQFLLTHPVRGATRPTRIASAPHAFLLTHPRERCDRALCACTDFSCISTHAPRERCDRLAKRIFKKVSISTHAPRERCDLILCHNPMSNHDFYSRTP